MAAAPSIRVLLVDDSALVRKIVTSSLEPFPDIRVVGTAPDPYIARERLVTLKPDVMVLDIEMPRMDGLTFLRLLMRSQPMPVIVFSSLTASGSDKALEALQAGAVDVLGKPGSAYSAFEDGTRLAEKIRAAAQARLPKAPPGRSPALLLVPAPVRPMPLPVHKSPAPPVPVCVPPGAVSKCDLVLMGASTGGTEALKAVLTALPAGMPPICIVQHIPAFFSRAFADRLNQLCPFEVREAEGGEKLRPGLALVAPGGRHMHVVRRLGQCLVQLGDEPPVHHQRPAVDILFESAVRAGMASKALAVLLTGMGADGARGMLALRQGGAFTIAQDEATSVVFGMPREAIRLGAAHEIAPLQEIPTKIARQAFATAAESPAAGAVNPK